MANRNVLLITADQWRADCLGAMGHPVLRTPALDRLAAEGTLFRRHYSVASPCGPSRASLLTGLYACNHRSVVNGTPLDRRFTNLALEARAAGYAPALFGYTDTAPDPRGLSPDDPALTSYEGVLPGFDPVVRLTEDPQAWLAWLRRKGYPEALLRHARIYLPAGPATGRIDDRPAQYAAEHSITAFLVEALREWLEGRPAGWFAHLSLLRPHPPWIASAPYNAMYDPGGCPPPVRAVDAAAEAAQHPLLAALLATQRCADFFAAEGRVADLPAADVAQVRAIYYGLIAELDGQLGRVLAHLDASGRRDDTLVIVTSDHGEMLGDRHLFGKSGWFDKAFHVPLIVRDPRQQRAGGVVDAFTESVDLMPTVLDWLGLPVPTQCDGHSLLPLLAGPVPAGWRDAAHWEFDFRDVRGQAAERHFGLRPEQCALAVRRSETDKYVHFAGLPPLWFDLAADPDELTDRAGDPACAGRVLAAAQAMLSWRLASHDRVLANMSVGEGGVVEWLPEGRRSVLASGSR